LYYGLKNIGVTNGDLVLLPSFICRDLLSSINSLGAIPVFYDLNKNLSPLGDLSNLPKCKAVIAVNYFGFPQDLNPFINYCKNNQSVLIEDNSQGFLSCDTKGQSLGTRSDLGIFSFRKTVPILYGAALLINNNKIFSQDISDIVPKNYISLNYFIKKMIKYSFQLIRINGINLFTSVVRRIRKIRTGHSYPQPDKDAEMKLPKYEAAPYNLIKKLDNLDLLEESTRRRELYLWVYNEIIKFGGNPVFNHLPKGCVPFGLPYYVPLSRVNKIEKKLSCIGLESFPWPDLPHEILLKIPNYYTELRCIKFLW